MVSAVMELYADGSRVDIPVEESRATLMTVDFSNVPKHRQHRSGVLRDRGNDPRPRNSEGKLLTPKQIRARARRKYRKAKHRDEEILEKGELEWLYKPLEEWTLEELAIGRPMAPDGTQYRGPKPKWITREIHEEAMERFKQAMKLDMNAATVDAMKAVQNILANEDVDHRGKPVVPASTKLDAAKFLIEHVVGKPTQHISQDISVKLQGLLGSVMVNPNEALAPAEWGGEGNEEGEPAYQLGHFPGHTIPMGGQEDIVDAEVIEDE